MSRLSHETIRHICQLACPDGDLKTDEDLLQAFIDRRDSDAFTAIVRRHGKLVMRVCRQALPDSHDAEDAFQATFLLLVRKADSIHRREVLGSWLYGVAHRVATRLRTQGKQRSRRERPVPEFTVGTPAPPLDAGELWAALHEEVLRLPDKYRVPVVLCYLEGKTHEETAQQLGWPTGTVAGRLARARDLLYRRLTRRGLAAPSAAGVALLLWGGSAPAVLPNELVRGSVVAAIEFASGATSSASISTVALSLAEGVLRTMLVNKIRNIGTVLLLACFAAFTIGAGLTTAGSRQSAGSESSGSTSLPSVARDGDKHADAASATLIADRTDVNSSDAKDDPLPAEARARFGSVRFLHPGTVGALAYSSDGKFLASAASDGSICLWDAANGKLLQTLNKPGSEGALTPALQPYGNVGAVAFSPDGRLLGAALVGRGVRFWETETGKEARTLLAGTANLQSFVMSPDGKFVYPVTEVNKNIPIYDAETGKVVKTLEGHTHFVTTVAFSSDGKWLVSGSEDQTVRIWDLETGKQKHVIEGHRDGVKSVTISPDSKRLASLSYDNTARVYDATTWEEVARIDGPRTTGVGLQHTQSAAMLALSADGKYLASAAMGWSPKLHEVATGKEICQFESAVSFSTAGLAFRPDGKSIAHGEPGGRIRFHDTTTGKASEDAVGHTGIPMCLAASPDGKTLVSGGNDRTLRFWDLATGKELRVIRAHTGAVAFVAFTPDGKHVLSASFDPADKVISVWDAASGKEDRPIRGSNLPFVNIAISPDGQKLCTSSQDSITRVWDIEERKEISQIPGTRPGFPTMPFTPDSKGVLSLTGTGLSVIDIETRKEVRKLISYEYDPAKVGKRPPVQIFNGSMTSSPDGTLALRFDYNGTMQIMDLTTGKDLVELEEKSPQARAIPGRNTFGPIVAFSPDGKTVATAWKDTSVRLWEASTGKVRHTFTGHTGAVSAITFTCDGKSLISAGSDSSILVWNVAATSPTKPLTDAELDKLWNALKSDGTTAFEAVRTLEAIDKQAATYLKDHVQPVTPVEDKKVAALLADLESEDFDKRQAATETLENLAELIAPALRKALEDKPSLETSRRLETILQTVDSSVLSDEVARHFRAIEVLEHCGTDEAKKVLAKLAKGAENARITRAAKAALARLERN